MLHRLSSRLFRHRAVQQWWAQRFRALRGDDVPWTPLARPLAACRVALVTTGGVHLRGDAPFDMRDARGDPSYRVIPGDVAAADLQITHDYYDHRDADRDINVVFPIEPLRRLQAAGHIAGAGPRFYSLMGHVEGPHLDTLLRRTAPELAARLSEDAVDVAIFTPA